MNIPFRQGLVQTPTIPFLSLSSGRVSIVLGVYQTITMTIADGSADYLVTIPLSVTNAWTGPFIPGTNYWLYFDINTITGQLSYNSTQLMPFVGVNPPTMPTTDQHWFNTATNRMFVYTAGNNWAHVIRVFAAQLNQGSSFVSMSINSPKFTGTQVGLLTPSAAGAIVYDSNGSPLIKGDGTFFTTENTALTGISNASQVKIGSIAIDAISNNNMVAYTVVRFVDFNTIGPATNFMSAIGSYGIIQTSVGIGNTVAITMEGIVTNTDWNWTTAGVNAPLYVDNDGQLTAVPSPSGTVVAAVVGINSVIISSALSFVSPAPGSFNPSVNNICVKQNSDSTPLFQGQPCFSSAVGMVGHAEASNDTLASVIGLCSDTTINPNGSGNIQTTAIMSASVGQWNAVTGSTSGLTEGSIYYLHPTIPGYLTTTAPSTAGQYVVEIGVAISSTQISINIQPSILL